MSNGIRRGLLDLIDGGGIGAQGDKFEGGGLFSLLANALGATPYGSEDRMRDAMQAQRPVSRPSTMQAMETISSSLRPQGRPEGALGPFGGAGANVSGAAAERGMGLDPFGGPGDFNPANAAPVQPSAPGMTFAPSVEPDFTMPDGSPINPPVPKLSGEQIAQKFGDDMVRVYGIDTANSIMSSPSAQGIYLHYINNGYQLPEL